MQCSTPCMHACQPLCTFGHVHFHMFLHTQHATTTVWIKWFFARCVLPVCQLGQNMQGSDHATMVPDPPRKAPPAFKAPPPNTGRYVPGPNGIGYLPACTEKCGNFWPVHFHFHNGISWLMCWHMCSRPQGHEGNGGEGYDYDASHICLACTRGEHPPPNMILYRRAQEEF